MTVNCLADPPVSISWTSQISSSVEAWDVQCKQRIQERDQLGNSCSKKAHVHSARLKQRVPSREVFRNLPLLQPFLPPHCNLLRSVSVWTWASKHLMSRGRSQAWYKIQHSALLTEGAHQLYRNWKSISSQKWNSHKSELFNLCFCIYFILFFSPQKNTACKHLFAYFGALIIASPKGVLKRDRTTHTWALWPQDISKYMRFATCTACRRGRGEKRSKGRQQHSLVCCL